MYDDGRKAQARFLGKVNNAPPHIDNYHNQSNSDDFLMHCRNDTSEGAPSYGNTMFDRRVARGSNFAAQRPNVISVNASISYIYKHIHISVIFRVIKVKVIENSDRYQTSTKQVLDVLILLLISDN